MPGIAHTLIDYTTVLIFYHPDDESSQRHKRPRRIAHCRA